MLFAPLTVFLGLILLLGGLEASLRLAGFGTSTALLLVETFADSSQRYIPNPSIARRFIFRPPHEGITETGLIIHYDSFTLQKASNEKRVVFLGDSTIFGMPDPVNLTIPAFLERLLKAAYPGEKVEVFNCAMTSINSHTMLEMARELDPLNPDLVLVYTGHNEFYGPHGVGSTVQFIENRPMQTFISVLARTRCYQLLQRFPVSAGSQVKPGSMTLMEAMVGNDAIGEEDAAFRKTLAAYRSNLELIARRFTGTKTKVAFCGLVANERDCAPLNPLTSSKVDEDQRRDLQILSREAWNYLLAGNLNEASATISKIRASDAGYGNAVFLQGRLAEELGDIFTANLHYKQAILRDGMRFRAPPDFNHLIKDVAADMDACFIDLEPALRGGSSSGLLGASLFVDHVHPNVDGKYLLANAIAHAICSEDLLQIKASPASLPDETSCLTQAGHTPIDSINSLNRMIRFHRRYPLNRILNVDEMTELLEVQKKTHESALSPAYQAAIAHMGELEPVLNRDENDRIIHHDELAFRLYELGAWNEAGNEYYSLIQSSNKYFPGVPSYYLQLSECIKKRTDLPDTVKSVVLPRMYAACKQVFLRCSLRDGPDRARETYEMGIYAANSGDQPVAQELLEESIRLDAQPRKLETLMQIEWNSGNKIRAREIARQLSLLDSQNSRALSILSIE